MTVRIIHGDCREVLPTLPEDSFDCVVTSPPYWGLRDYQVEGQIGLEPTLAGYLETMVGVMREVRRVLKSTGTSWLNIGDGYNNFRTQKGPGQQLHGRNELRGKPAPLSGGRGTIGLKEKDLLMVPNRLAILLQDDGWYVRSEIIWHKLNPMPESMIDRPTSAHEKIWLLTKSDRYFYDALAIAELSEQPDRKRADKVGGASHVERGQHSEGGIFTGASTRNARNVWTIACEPYRGAHYAVMPSALAERCIKAGSSERGCCPHCGKPWERQTERVDQGWDGSRYGERAVAASGGAITGGTAASTLGSSNGKLTGKTKTVGWLPTCSCAAHEPIPAKILDCFGGAGTTGLVADRLGRDATLIELNPANREMAHERVRMDGPLFSDVRE